MKRIKIADLQKDAEISREEMKGVFGGTIFRIDSKKDKAEVVRVYAGAGDPLPGTSGEYDDEYVDWN